MSDDNQFYGWYDEAGQELPTYDPPHNGPCAYCGRPITGDDVRTHSMMMAGPVYAKRSYFYRTHRTCDTGKTGNGMDDFIFDMIARNGD